MGESRRAVAVPPEALAGDRVPDPARGVPETGRLILVSNRLPVTIIKRSGSAEIQPSSGGLAAALWPVHRAGSGLWVGWPGELSGDKTSERAIISKLQAERLTPVILDSKLVDDFYHGFSNSTLWPLLHYFSHLAVLNRKWWESYRRVNEMFADVIEGVARPDDTIWVHDYHLMLLPAMLRERLGSSRIGFFLHTPFPSAEIFRILPWRREVLDGMLGADLVGFHVYDYLRHFRVAAMRVLGLEGEADRLIVDGRVVRLGAFPVGIEAGRYWRTATQDPEALARLESLPQELKGRQLILGVDRMDYTKGIPERLAGYELFLERFRKYHGKVEFIQVGVPTRTRVGHYRALRQRVEEIVGRINGRFGTPDWTPVKYIFRPISFGRLCALYRYASVALVTPLRDGMNLVAKEYIACKNHGGDGVLILSEFAGAAPELGEALLVNPFDPEAIAGAVHRALTMPAAERKVRLNSLLVRVWQGDVRPWGRTFLEALATCAGRAEVYPARLGPFEREEMLNGWKVADGRALVLDYDGTLSGIAPRPDLARPDRPLQQLLRRLGTVPGVEVVVVSGRDRETLDRWLGGLPIALAAEHGRWLRDPGRGWEDMLAGQAPSWLGRVREILEQAAAATPGSFVETKSASVAWHFRGANSEQADLRVRELEERLGELREDPPIDVVHGKKVIEVRVLGVSKGSVLLTWLARKPPVGFLLVAGDDQTDEEMFDRLPPTSWSIHVGSKSSRARFSVPDPATLRTLLHQLSQASVEVRP
jgi:trehalose 6-phosphate synthase/phosphatase